MSDESLPKEDIIKQLVKPVLLALIVFLAVISAIAYYFGKTDFIIAVWVLAPIGFIALIVQASDISDVMFGRFSKRIIFRFVFRLACFAILLYVVLIEFKLSPFGVALGITLPIFCYAGVAFNYALKGRI